MKKIYKTFTFYFIIIGIIVVLLNVIGVDDMNILMIGLNPLLNLLDNSKVIRDFMNSGTYLWHIASFLTNILYGIILDFIRIKTKNSNCAPRKRASNLAGGNPVWLRFNQPPVASFVLVIVIL